MYQTGHMYLPAHFTITEQGEIENLLKNLGAADLVTRTNEGLTSTFLPLLYSPSADHLGSLHGHVARANSQWNSTVDPEVLVIAHIIDGYISPNGYPSKAENPKAVPTWNYVTLNIHGKLIVHDDPEWTLGLVRRLTDHHEANHAIGRSQEPWSVDDAPADYINTMVKAIVGLEIVIDRIEAKAKLSQNKSESDAFGAASDLEHGSFPETQLAQAIRSTRK